MITKGMITNRKIRERVNNIACYILENQVTIREAAKKFGVSKSMVHLDITKRLKMVNPELYIKIREHLDYHSNVKHLRGGEATRRLHKKLA